MPAPFYKPNIGKMLYKEMSLAFWVRFLFVEAEGNLLRSACSVLMRNAVSAPVIPYRRPRRGQMNLCRTFLPLTDSIQCNLKLWCVIYWFLSLGCLGWFYPVRISENKSTAPPPACFSKRKEFVHPDEVYTNMSELTSHMATPHKGGTFSLAW